MGQKMKKIFVVAVVSLFAIPSFGMNGLDGMNGLKLPNNDGKPQKKRDRILKFHWSKVNIEDDPDVKFLNELNKAFEERKWKIRKKILQKKGEKTSLDLDFDFTARRVSYPSAAEKQLARQRVRDQRARDWLAREQRRYSNVIIESGGVDSYFGLNPIDDNE